MRGPTTSVVLIIAIFVSFTVSGTLAAAGEAEDVLPPSVEPRPPTITVTLSQEEIEIRTGPGHSGQIVVNGTVTVGKPIEARTDTVYVTLNIQLNSHEVLGSIFPQNLEFGMNTAEQTETISITLQVPPLIPFIDIDGTFSIKGDWAYKFYDGEGSIPDTYGQIILRPFCRFSGVVLNQKDLDNVPVGSWRTAKLEVINQGNSRTTISLSVMEENRTLECVLGHDSVILDQGESTTVPIKVRRSEGGAKPKTYVQGIRLQAKDPDGHTIIYDTSITMKTVYTPGSFFKSALFKFIIAGIVAFVILVVLLAFLVKRRRKRKEAAKTDLLL
ncbi:MAG: hypothetical protein ACMUHU_00055 [Thermoplasmatota archaeon]